MGPPLTKRIIVCVDGTWYNADGQEGRGQGNNSNFFRIFASIKHGEFEERGRKIKQVAEYFYGIDVKKKPLDKFNDGVSGDGCKELIQRVYQYICSHARTPEDEVWLYGFSRGAYVVRAVSGLLCHISALSNTPEEAVFNKDYKQALGFLSKKQQTEFKEKGELYHFFMKKTRASPVVRFVGTFDTVKRATDSVEHDLSFNDSIKHVRHAVAMNEDRYHFLPELYDTNSMDLTAGRSLIQAWFVGAHADIGGGAADDGLALYPLQWMLIESRKCGLVLEHNPERRFRNLIEDPLGLAFPEKDQPGQETAPDSTWSFKYSNGIEVDMHDLRASHNHGNLQKWPAKKLKKQNADQKSPERRPLAATHMVRINSGFRTSVLRSGDRPHFQDGFLKGYHESGPMGTIVHPSVYFLLETYPRLGIKKALKGLEAYLQNFRNCHLIGNDPWIRTREYTVDMQSCRILICGDTGVGKSTLLNRVFGIDLTQENDGQRGKHNIDEAFEHDQHPGIIIHDSEGFQSGDKKEVIAFESFIKKRSHLAPLEERLHAIWVCIDTNTSRPVQTAMETVIKLITHHAPILPVFIVGTKKDQFLKLQDGVENKQIEALERSEELDTKIQARVNHLLEDRQRFFETRYREECKGYNEKTMRFAFVSKDDQSSIQNLMRQTIDRIADDSVHMSLVAAQVYDVEPKIEMAIDETVRLLRHAVSSVYATAPIIFGPTVIGPTVSRILCNNIVRYFGFPKVTGEHVDNVMSNVVWENLAKFMVQSVSQEVAIWGGISALTLTTIFGGLALLPGTPLLEAPPAARMITKCACDLILILDRAFSYGGRFVTKEEIRQASIEYKTKGLSSPALSKKSIRSLVHDEVEKLIPLVSLKNASMSTVNNISHIRNGMEKTIQGNRIGNMRLTRVGSMSDSVLSSSTSTEEPEEIRIMFADSESKK